MTSYRTYLAIVCVALSSAACGNGGGGSEDASTDADAGASGPKKPVAGPQDDEYVYDGPTKLSETGLYSDFGARTIAADVHRFAPGYPLFSDGEEKHRYVQLPAGTKIDTSRMDNWSFPTGTKAWKEFYVGGKLVETRMLWKQGTSSGFDEWTRVAFVWNEDGSDAIATPTGVRGVAGTAHDVPSTEDCRYCHGNVADGLIGFSAIELSKADGAGADSGLLLSFASKGWFTSAPSADFAVPGSGNIRDTLAYLHGNCGFCHNDEGKLEYQSAMRLRLKVGDKTPEETGLYTTAINLVTRHVMGSDIDRAVVPGQPEKSQLYMRMITLDITRMPPKGPKQLDTVGSEFVRRWIAALPP